MKVMETLQKIVSETGNDKFISVSDKENELAELMVYSSEKKPNYLAIHGHELFPLSEVKNILYRAKTSEDDVDLAFNYTSTFLVIVFELDDNTSFFIDFTDCGPCCSINYKGKGYDDDTYLSALREYNSERELRYFYRNIIFSVEGMLETWERDPMCNPDEIERCLKEVDNYVELHPEDEETLLCYAYAAVIYSENFPSEFPIKTILQRNLKDKFLKYVEEYELDTRDYQDSYLYIGQLSTALRLLDKYSSSTDEKNK